MNYSKKWDSVRHSLYLYDNHHLALLTEDVFFDDCLKAAEDPSDFSVLLRNFEDYRKKVTENAYHPPKAIMEKTKELFPKGKRVILCKMDDKQAPPIGTAGTVSNVDSIGTIFVDWDNGSRLGVAFFEDEIIFEESLSLYERDFKKCLFNQKKLKSNKAKIEKILKNFADKLPYEKLRDEYYQKISDILAKL